MKNTEPPSTWKNYIRDFHSISCCFDNSVDVVGVQVSVYESVRAGARLFVEAIFLDCVETTITI